MRRQARGRLVEEKNVVLACKLEPDVQPLAFPAAQCFGEWTTDNRIASIAQPGLSQHPLCFQPHGVLREFGAAQACAEVEILEDGEVFEEQIMLWDVANAAMQSCARPQRSRFDPNIAGAWKKHGGENTEER